MKVVNVSIIIVLLGCLLTGCRKSPNSRNISRNSVVMVEDYVESKSRNERKARKQRDSSPSNKNPNVS